MDERLRVLRVQRVAEPPEAEVDRAVVLYCKLEGILTDPGRGTELVEAFEMLSVRASLNFAAGMKKPRVSRGDKSASNFCRRGSALGTRIAATDGWRLSDEICS